MRTVPKFFNTAGPIMADIHYNVEPLSRFNLEEIESLIYQRKYFVLHAPRQTGKTSCMLALRDYRIVLSNQDIITGGSAFNIKAESLRLGNFSRWEIHDLYMQHTAATGQEFDDACFPLLWEATEGQPWLVNAVGYEVTYKMKENRDRSVRIIPEMLYRACENIIYRRDTHIDILIDKLREERVRRIFEVMLGEPDISNQLLLSTDDVEYVVDNGLIVLDKPWRIANGIYRQIITDYYKK
jgi:hypothetical protein